jgi:hypothetical protein
MLSYDFCLWLIDTGLLWEFGSLQEKISYGQMKIVQPLGKSLDDLVVT